MTKSSDYTAGFEAAKQKAIKVCEDLIETFSSTQYSINQSLGSFSERFACAKCIEAISKIVEGRNV